MDMMRFMAGLLLMGLLVSCAASKEVQSPEQVIPPAEPPPIDRLGIAQDKTKAGIVMVIMRVDGKSDALSLYIDGEYAEGLKLGTIKGFELPNGRHGIRVQYHEKGNPVFTSQTLYIDVADTKHIIHVSFNADSNNWRDSKVVLEEAEVQSIETAGAPDNSLLDSAVRNTFNTLSPNLPQGLVIAFVNIAASQEKDKRDAFFIIEELTVLLVNSRKYRVVERQTLEVIRQEHNFQMSGEVDDSSVISIGQFSGAQVVITGTITGIGSQRRLRLRALDVKTSEVLAMSSEKI